MTDVPTWVRRGQKVVCIFDGAWANLDKTYDGVISEVPIRGNIYTLNGDYIVAFGLVFIGIYEFLPHRIDHTLFRPVQNQKSEQEDLEHFRPLLDVDPMDIAERNLDDAFVRAGK